MTTPQSPQAPSSPEAAAVDPMAAYAAPASLTPPAAPTKSKRKKLISILGVAATIIVAVIVRSGINHALNGPVHAKAGECVKVTGSDDHPNVDTVSCGDGSATHTVSKVIDNTFDLNACGGDFDALAQKSGGEKFVLCLTPKQ